jgi:hypothetical protein
MSDHDPFIADPEDIVPADDPAGVLRKAARILPVQDIIADAMLVGAAAIDQTYALRVELAETQRRLEQADRNWEAASSYHYDLEERLHAAEDIIDRLDDQLAELRKAAAALYAEAAGLGSSHMTLQAALVRVAELLREGRRVEP